MKYVSLDIETTGLSYKCDIIEIGLVVEDTTKFVKVSELPSLRILMEHEDPYWEPYAKGMHERSGLIDEIASEAPSCPIIRARNYEGSSKEVYRQAFTLMFNWLKVHFPNGNIPLAGKNLASFDIPRLKKKGWRRFFEEYTDFKVLDVGSLYLTEHKANSFGSRRKSLLPGLQTCLQYAGIKKSIAHNSIEDAQDVIMCIRHKIGPDEPIPF